MYEFAVYNIWINRHTRAHTHTSLSLSSFLLFHTVVSSRNLRHDYPNVNQHFSRWNLRDAQGNSHTHLSLSLFLAHCSRWLWLFSVLGNIHEKAGLTERTIFTYLHNISQVSNSVNLLISSPSRCSAHQGTFQDLRDRVGISRVGIGSDDLSRISRIQ